MAMLPGVSMSPPASWPQVLSRGGVAAFTVALTVVVAGCGGGSSSSTSSRAASASNATAANGKAPTPSLAPSSTPAPPVPAAERICVRRNAQVAADSGGTVNEATITHLARSKAAIQKRELAELRRLRPPASRQADWNKMLASRQAYIALLLVLVRDAHRNLEKALPAFGFSSGALQKQLTAFTHDGFAHCLVFE
jgi:hypothetical protein